jgi:hypothetical protein
MLGAPGSSGIWRKVAACLTSADVAGLRGGLRRGIIADAAEIDIIVLIQCVVNFLAIRDFLTANFAKLCPLACQRRQASLIGFGFEGVCHCGTGSVFNHEIRIADFRRRPGAVDHSYAGRNADSGITRDFRPIPE